MPALQRACARGSPNRQELFERRGVFQAPYLEDPNTGVAMFESTGRWRRRGGSWAELRLIGGFGLMDGRWLWCVAWRA